MLYAVHDFFTRVDSFFLLWKIGDWVWFLSSLKSNFRFQPQRGLIFKESAVSQLKVLLGHYNIPIS